MVKGNSPSELVGRIAFHALVIGGFAVIVLPLVLVVWLSFVSDAILTVPPDGYSFRWYAEMFRQPQFMDGFATSLIVALVATLAGLALTIPASFVLARMAFRGRDAILHLLMSPLIVPAIVIGSALYMMFVEVEIRTGLPITGSVWGLAAGHVLLTIPWSIRLVSANLVGVNPSVEEAALSLGATPLATALRITLPIVWPGVVAAALFSFVVSFGNLEVSLFLVSAGETTLPIAVLQYLQWKINPTVAAVSVLQIVVVGTGLLLTSRFVNLARTV
ncbi:ABC transporter permease [Salinarimonas rosea]|uniref:ABC transporter permease n=1 Tax=Salinarimonas rosea TaxID=552063 RepID=UPI000429F7DF|nr:ABC transporter permease [Salinarimonas rosea]